MNEIMNRVIRVTAETLGADSGEIKPDHNFVEDLGADSLDVVELVMFLEEEFDLEISDEKAESLTTVQAAADYIKEALC